MRSGKDTNTGWKRAREAREEWRLGAAAPLPCVVTVAEHCAEIPVVIAPLPDDLAGCLMPAPLIWVNARHAAVRCRFTVAHELGHLRCGHTPDIVDPVKNFYETRDPKEIQANAFAAELLMPEAGMLELVDGEPGLDDVVRIAAHFGVSALAVRHRLNALQLVSPRRADRLKDEIDDKLHFEVAKDLGLTWPEDLLGVCLEGEKVPRIPAALEGSGLAALLRNEADVETVGASAGVDPALLADALREIS